MRGGRSGRGRAREIVVAIESIQSSVVRSHHDSVVSAGQDGVTYDCPTRLKIPKLVARQVEAIESTGIAANNNTNAALVEHYLRFV